MPNGIIQLVGEPFKRRGCLLREVEMSWDTGFEKAGRYTFNAEIIYAIDKYDDKWYIAADLWSKHELYEKGIKPQKPRQIARLYVLNQNGEFEKPVLPEPVTVRRNIYYFGDEFLLNNSVSKFPLSYKDSYEEAEEMKSHSTDFISPN